MRHYKSSKAPVALGRVTYKGQLTIPKEIRDVVGLEDGDLVEIRAEGNGSLVVTPKILVDKSQAWFWTAEWQKMEREAEKDLKLGRSRRFQDVRDLLKDLRSQ